MGDLARSFDGVLAQREADRWLCAREDAHGILRPEAVESLFYLFRRDGRERDLEGEEGE